MQQIATQTWADLGAHKRAIPTTLSNATLRHAALRCNTLHHAATHTSADFGADKRTSPSTISTKQAATRCNTHLDRFRGRPQGIAQRLFHRTTLQHAATRCNTLQHATTRCNTHLGGFRGRQKGIAQCLFPTVIVSLGTVGVFLGVFLGVFWRTAAFAACVTFFAPGLTVSVSVGLPVAVKEVEGGGGCICMSENECIQVYL